MEDAKAPKDSIPGREEDVLAFWKEQGVFEKSLEKRAPKGEFVFYDGPPFATGLPHTGSMLSSVIKDVIPRYKTMQGYRVPRRWGWDCHGLPIENLIEKRLNLKSKKDIVALGIDTFNEAARASVMEFERDWEKYVERIGRWVDFKNSYKTMDNSYIESVWWALKELHGKKLLYEGKKVLLYCPHCETPLAKAEIAMDNTYKDITEESVTAKFELVNEPGTYLLAWTTTPWTLPGNVGLAVGPAIVYCKVKTDEGSYIVARERLASVMGERKHTIVGEITGKELAGSAYRPLFDVPSLQSKKSYKVWAADFVSTEEGTGIVHTAVMYGEDDFVLGQKEGLPMVQLLNSNGTYNDHAPEFLHNQYIKKAEGPIKEDLEKRGLLFARANHAHSYPHCYRCGTALIYNAVVSWFINIQKVKNKMLAENEKIRWVPEHLKHGRFKHVVETAPDWTISRNRFWASPLPIWKERGGNRLMVVGSLDELREKTKKSGNQYFMMRHGQARSNVEDFMDGLGRSDNHLTEHGRARVHEIAQGIRSKKIDLIIASPFPRTRETAAIVRQELGLPESTVIVDDRLHEVRFGPFDGRPLEEWAGFFDSIADRFHKAPEGGESYADVKRRVGEFIFEVERRYVGKNILIVTHKSAGWLLHCIARQLSEAQAGDTEAHHNFMSNGQVYELPFVPYPHNANYDLDLHRPYIDSITLADSAGRTYERIPEVVDCWVESGSMPFASASYPREKTRMNPKRFLGLAPKGYPGDFIAEYIAQTRTWFYYMHAMGVLLFGKHSFKTVVTTGNILAADGSKMSKSKGNYTDPLKIMEKYGADAMRLHLMGSPVMQAEDLQFRDDDVREVHNRVLGILWNSYKFFELYKAEYDGITKAHESRNVLDRWVEARLAETIARTTESLEAYDTPHAVRALREFVDDYSTWYLRRSRTRMKEDGMDKQWALATQYDCLTTLSKLLAPLAPFMAESIWRGAGGEGESVHLATWPVSRAVDEEVIRSMASVRTFATMALQQREKAGIKIRQPLSALAIEQRGGTVLAQEYLDVLADEINVKRIEWKDAPVEEPAVSLDTDITPELREEGIMRDLIRHVQEWRKEQGLTISDRPEYTLEVSGEEAKVAKKHKETIMVATGLSDLRIDA